MTRASRLSWISILGGTVFPLVAWRLLLSPGYEWDSEWNQLMMFLPAFAQLGFAVCGLASFFMLPKVGRGWIVARSVAGVVLGLIACFALGVLAFALTAGC